MAAKKQAKKTGETPVLPLKERVVGASLDLAASIGWDLVTLTDIADEARISLAELSAEFDDKTDILIAYGKIIDRKVLTACADPDPSTPERDRLFDILMERFDVIGQRRDGVLSILRSIRFDPKQAVISLPHLGRSMAWMLEAAGIETAGPRGALRVAGLMGVYLHVLRVWTKDDGADLPVTMAALDKALGKAEQAANSFKL